MVAMRVTVLGMGAMGAGMAQSLLRDGFDVTVWNRTVERSEPLAEDGALVALDPTAAVADADVVVAMLFDTAAMTWRRSTSVSDLFAIPFAGRAFGVAAVRSGSPIAVYRTPIGRRRPGDAG